MSILHEINQKCKESYTKHLYGNDYDGYVQAIQILDGSPVFVKSVNKNIADIFQLLDGKKDVFITPNTFYKPERKNQNIRHFRALYIDLDIKDKYSKQEAVYELYILSENEQIPKPTMIIDSGRGIHTYWRIENAPMQAAFTWQELEDYLYNQLKHLGADIQATSAANVLRMPGTINSRNEQLCKVLFVNDNTYSMRDLKDKFIHKPKKDKPGKSKKSGKVKNLFNSYSLHYARAADIKTLCRLRGYNVTGYRNALLHCYSYWKGITIREDQELLNMATQLNESFTEPLRQSEVNSIVKSVSKAVEKFIDYEQGLRSGQRKRVTKGMRDKGGYWYTNETLINMLGISKEEELHMKTIIGKEEKYRRKNKKRNDKRRNEAGYTARQQATRDRHNVITKLRQEGLTQSAIAKELSISQQAVSLHLKRYK